MHLAFLVTCSKQVLVLVKHDVVEVILVGVGELVGANVVLEIEYGDHVIYERVDQLVVRRKHEFLSYALFGPQELLFDDRPVVESSSSVRYVHVVGIISIFHLDDIAFEEVAVDILLEPELICPD